MKKLVIGGVLALALAAGIGWIITTPMPHNLPVRYRVYDLLHHGILAVSDFTSKIGITTNQFSAYNHLLAALQPVLRRMMPESAIDVKDTEIMNVGVRIYTLHSGEQKHRPGLIYFHGGGFVLGGPDATHPFCLSLAGRLNAVVISVDYRLAPKHLFPAAFDDAYQVVTHVVNNAESFGMDQKRIVLAGDSAGGNLAAGVTQAIFSLVKNCPKDPIAGQVLLFPSVQFLDFNLPSALKNKDMPILPQYDMAMFWSNYMVGDMSLVDIFLQGNHSLHLRNTEYAGYLNLKSVSEETIKTAKENVLKTVPEHVLEALTDPRASPLMAPAEDIKCLPPTLVLTGKYDVLSDDGFHYASRLKKANVDVEHKEYPSVHDFILVETLPKPTELCESLLGDMETFLERVFKGGQNKV